MPFSPITFCGARKQDILQTGRFDLLVCELLASFRTTVVFYLKQWKLLKGLLQYNTCKTPPQMSVRGNQEWIHCGQLLIRNSLSGVFIPSYPFMSCYTHRSSVARDDGIFWKRCAWALRKESRKRGRDGGREVGREGWTQSAQINCRDWCFCQRIVTSCSRLNSDHLLRDGAFKGLGPTAKKQQEILLQIQNDNLLFGIKGVFLIHSCV